MLISRNCKEKDEIDDVLMSQSETRLTIIKEIIYITYHRCSMLRSPTFHMNGKEGANESI